MFESNSARGCSHMESDVCAAGSPSVCGGGQCLSVFDGYSCECLPREEGDVCERGEFNIIIGTIHLLLCYKCFNNCYSTTCEVGVLPIFCRSCNIITCALL